MNINTRILNLTNRLCKNIFLSIIYENNIGIKCFNQLVSSSMFDYYVTNGSQVLSFDNLYLGFDGLKDDYTLLGTTIFDSPHYDLVKNLNSVSDTKKTEYIYRRKNGTLDFLHPVIISDDYVQFMQNRFKDKINLIQSGKYDPVKIVSINGKNYIADGKHTAATCALLGITPKCFDITPVVFDSWFWWIHKKMLKSKADYKKHIRWFNEFKDIRRINSKEAS